MISNDYIHNSLANHLMTDLNSLLLREYYIDEKIPTIKFLKSLTPRYKYIYIACLATMEDPIPYVVEPMILKGN